MNGKSLLFDVFGDDKLCINMILQDLSKWGEIINSSLRINNRNIEMLHRLSWLEACLSLGEFKSSFNMAWD